MRRWLLYRLVLLGVLLTQVTPFSGTDVALLEPVEVIRIGISREQVTLETDTGQWGVGDTVLQALKDLKDTTAKRIFLDTADYLLLQKGSESLVEEIAPLLRPGCRVCVQTGEADLAKIAEFLRTHVPQATLHSLKITTDKLPQLRCDEGRMELVP